MILPILLALLLLLESSQSLRRSNYAPLEMRQSGIAMPPLGTKNQHNIGKFMTWNFLRLNSYRFFINSIIISRPYIITVNSDYVRK